jgi:hypothetical protein
MPKMLAKAGAQVLMELLGFAQALISPAPSIT